MLQFGIRGHDMPQAPFEEWVKSIADAGFCCTQLALAKAVQDFPVGRETMTPGMAMYMRRVFEKNQVDVAVLGCYRNLATPDETELADTLKWYEAHLRFAAHLGCGMVGTETGAVNREYRYEEANHTEAALDVFAERLKRVVDMAERLGVLVGVEPVWCHTMYNQERKRKVLDMVNSPNLRVILDPVNLLTPDNYKEQDELVRGAFELFGEEIAAIHVKDFAVRDSRFAEGPMALGEGEFNFPLLFGLIKKRKPCVHVLLENSIPENVMQSYEYAKRVYVECQSR